MEDSSSSSVFDGKLTGIRFGLATSEEICISSNSDCPISHSSQLSNPFLGLPLESGKCESCGTAEPGKCEGHFGYIELPIPIYHPCHVGELKRMLSLVCLKCLKMKNMKIKNIVLEGALACCVEASQISIYDVKTKDGAYRLVLKLPSRSRSQSGCWNFLERYGFRYGDGSERPLLPCEVMVILRKLPEETRRTLAGKGYFPQAGYILQHLPVPPNCLSVPDISDGITVMSSDLSLAMLKKVLKQVEIIKSSRSGEPNFESHEVEANDLQILVSQYFLVRGTSKASRDIDARFGINKEPHASSTKAWLEKMKTLFIRKGSGFSSRSVITGDPYKRVEELGLPFEIAQRITFEERVNHHNMKYLQKLVDEKLCLTYRDGLSTYSLREGSKGHTCLRPGQVVHRRIMDGDTVFINRPPTTHKHSLQALSVYVHDDHTVKINPLICGPLSADFDGDCVHLFYPQSLAAKAEVLELFSVEKQLLSSHNGNLNLQLATDSLLSLKMMFKNYFLNRAAAQQLAMFVLNSLPEPAVSKGNGSGPLWTALQMLQTALPTSFDCRGERHLICKSDILKIDFNRDLIQSIINDIVTSICFEKGPNEVLKFFNSLQPLLMENLFSEGFSVSLEDFSICGDVIGNIQRSIQDISPLLCHLRSTYNEWVELQLEDHLRLVRMPVSNFILKSSALGTLIDSRSDSSINKVVQQIGFLGLQLSVKGKFYSRALVGDMASLCQNKYPDAADYPSEEIGLVRGGLFHGLDPYQEMVHSISSREVIVRSSRGLTEPGTLFKNLMAILRDVVICYDGTVRNVCSNSIIQFEYGVRTGTCSQGLFTAGEPVGVLAATAMSNPAYKAVLDSSPSSNSSWEMMKEILLCGVNFKNDLLDRRIILYLNDCGCGRKYCREKAAYLVKDQLKKVSLKDIAVEFLIEYGRQPTFYGSSEMDAGMVGHVHLKKNQLKDSNISMNEVLEKCQDTISSCPKKMKILRRVVLSVSECCPFQQSCESKFVHMPCLKFFWKDASDHSLEESSHNLVNKISPFLLDTIIKGDPRVCSANIIWISPDTNTWIRSPSKSEKGELALDVVLEKKAVKQSGDAWRIVMDSCLSVLHLIDTRRSIPYAIKQVQELLGVACAFEQAVQRLSTSVTMVAKGILKEHLILLANSMTCAGHLIGFNMGGIKSLSRSLNVQVPFTEATLFTPKKCFERAAEKCHVDSLSSIVASCSWGKHVAVGTGSSFDVLWDTRGVGLNQLDESDVYNFLHLVRSCSNKEEPNSACLGEEIDNLEPEVENMELGFSPVHNSFDKPIFDDGAEFEYGLENENLDGRRPTDSNWEKVPSLNVESHGDRQWVAAKKPKSNNNSWSSWEADTVQGQELLSRKAHDNSSISDGWRTTESGKRYNESGPWSAMGKKVEEADGIDWSNKGGEHLLNQSMDLVSPAAGAWSAKAQGNSSKSGDWDSMISGKESNQSGSWAAQEKRVVEVVETGWSKKNGQRLPGSDLNHSVAGVWSGRAQDDSSKSTRWDAGGYGKRHDKSGSLATWGNKVMDTDGTCWNKKNDNPQLDQSAGVTTTNSRAWPHDQTETLDTGGYGKRHDQLESLPTWGNKIKEADVRGWNKKNDISQLDQSRGVTTSNSGGWDKDQTENLDVRHNDSRLTENCWVSKNAEELATKSKSSLAWDSLDNESLGKVGLQSEIGWQKESAGNPWDSCQNAVDQRTNQSVKTSGWGSPKVSSWNEGDVESQLGQQKRFGFKKDPTESSRGWGSSNAIEWKKKRGPARSAGGSNDDSFVSGVFTATRQRLDMFTSEEQDVLLDVEPIMQSIRRIMHQSRYNDGDPLSADDQSYILDNVFNYHPDKAIKMGAGVDYVMVAKHSSFQESRCFYVVSTDGHKEDFSYRKCLENLIKEKHPDKAGPFISKYFRKPRSGSGGNREHSVPLEEPGPENRQ